VELACISGAQDAERRTVTRDDDTAEFGEDAPLPLRRRGRPPEAIRVARRDEAEAARRGLIAYRDCLRERGSVTSYRKPGVADRHVVDVAVVVVVAAIAGDLRVLGIRRACLPSAARARIGAAEPRVFRGRAAGSHTSIRRGVFCAEAR